MLIRNAFALVNRLFPHEEASAHCDIPCGIYDPHAAQIGALTVIRMNQLIEGLEDPAKDGKVPPKADRDKYVHAIARYTATKESHAEIVKHEIRVITGDFFKADNTPEGLFPLVNNIMKTASKARQNVDAAAANELLDLVNQFAEHFWTAKNVKTKKAPSNQAVGGEIVVPA